VQCHLSLCPNCRLVHEAAKQTLQLFFNEDVKSEDLTSYIARTRHEPPC
jgi:hypothetical protein